MVFLMKHVNNILLWMQNLKIALPNKFVKLAKAHHPKSHKELGRETVMQLVVTFVIM